MNERSSLSVPDRVHIVPLGYEYDRILEPLQELDANKVVLLGHSEQEDDPAYLNEVRELLHDNETIRVEERECDIFEMYSAIGEIAKIADSHADDDVYVNLATGSKVTAIGGMIACMLTDATPYYVRAEMYGGEEEGPPSEPVSSGVVGIEGLPEFHIENPPRQLIKVLEHIEANEPVRKGELIEFGQEAELPFLSEYSAANETARYRLLDTHIVEPLQSRGDIQVEEVGRRKDVTITEKGRNTLDAFEYLL